MEIHFLNILSDTNFSRGFFFFFFPCILGKKHFCLHIWTLKFQNGQLILN